MSTVPVFVGLDYSLTGVQVCVLNREGKMLGNQKVPDRVDAIVQAIPRMLKALLPEAGTDITAPLRPPAQQLLNHGLTLSTEG